MGSFMYSPEIETMARADLAALQLDRLKKILQYAYRQIGHYRHAFDDVGMKPKQLSTLADLRHFPFTLKDHMRATYPFDMFALPLDDIARVHVSSGTTGRPTVVGYSTADLENWADLMARSLVAMGVKPSDIFHNANGYGLFTGGLGFHDGAQRLGAMVVPVSGGNTERQIQLMGDFGATVLSATPSYALHIAEVADKMGVDLKSGPLRIGCFGAEPWSEAMRGELEARLGIKALDMYGLSEVMGPGVACECHQAQDGLHGWEDHFLFEVVDPDTGEILANGDTGELVITTLTKTAAPMIRYRTRDITSLLEEPCVCGRSHIRIRRVTGRYDDMLIIRGVNIYPSQIEELLVGFEGIAPHYVLVVERQGAMDTLTIEVEVVPEIVGDEDKCQALAEAAQRHIKTMAGVNCAVEIKQPGEIPRSRGKAVRVRDLRS